MLEGCLLCVCVCIHSLRSFHSIPFHPIFFSIHYASLWCFYPQKERHASHWMSKANENIVAFVVFCVQRETIYTYWLLTHSDRRTRANIKLILKCWPNVLRFKRTEIHLPQSHGLPSVELYIYCVAVDGCRVVTVESMQMEEWMHHLTITICKW